MHKTDTDLLDKLFLGARSQNGWTSEQVSDEELAAAFDIAKWGPTSMNVQPMRLVILRSQAAKERIKAALAPGNVEKAMTAPVLAILANDQAFYKHLPKFFPHKPDAAAIFEGKEALIEATAFRNGTLQAAYFMVALRAVGLDVGPMSGFNPAAVDAEFFAGTGFKTNFLCGIGHGDAGKVLGRLPRFSYTDISTTL